MALRSRFLAGAFLLCIVLCAVPRRMVHASSGEQKRVGAALFHEKGCEHCHGADGRGGELGPDLSIVGKRWKKPEIERQIHDGGGGMPAFGEVLQPDEVSALVEFLHAKRKAPKRAKASPPPPPPISTAGEDR